MTWAPLSASTGLLSDDKDLTLGRGGTLLNCPSHKDQWWDYMDTIRREETDAPLEGLLNKVTHHHQLQREFLDAILD